MTGLFSSFRADDPQLVVDIDRDKARALGLPLREVTDALQVFLGSQYVNDFDFNSRAYRVYVQADRAFRAKPEDLKQIYARADGGRMVALDSVVRVSETTSPQVISHFNMFRSAELTGVAAPGVSSGEALAAMENIARTALPPGFDFAWAGQSLEEINAGSQTLYIFALAVLLVYLVLAAQYQSWILPFIILLGVPLAVLGGLGAQFWRGFANDVFCQVGLVLLVGLAAKNSILIVEFAEQLRDQGRSITDAAIEAARIRLRPILMTSIAFILGVLPLAYATGAGAASRQSVGTTVAGGMLASTFLSIVFIPVLYVIIRTLVPGKTRHELHARGDAGGGAWLGSSSWCWPASAPSPRLASAQPSAPTAAQPPMVLPEVVSFADAVQRAIAANPTVERAATSVMNAEALLAQARAAVRPTVDGTIVMTVLDGERGFSGQVVQPQTQTLFAGAAAAPVLAMAQWAARAQAEQRVGVAQLGVDDVRRQVGVAAAEAYLAIFGAKRQVEVNEQARDNAQAQLDYARARREGGVGSRLNEVRAARELAVVLELLEQSRLAVALGQEALGLITASDRPLDAAGEPPLDAPAVEGESWLRDRTDIRLFDAQVDLSGANRRRELEGLGADCSGVIRAAVPHAVGPVPAVGHLARAAVGVGADLRRRSATRRQARPPGRLVAGAGRSEGGRAARQGRRACRSRLDRRRGPGARAGTRSRRPRCRGAAHHRHRVPRRRHHQHRGRRRAASVARCRDHGTAGRGPRPARPARAPGRPRPLPAVTEPGRRGRRGSRRDHRRHPDARLLH